MRKACLEMVYHLAKADSRIVFIGSDLGAGTLRQFQDELPERFFMEGISEANLIGMSAGLALEGKVVYVNTIATFLTRRCLEQVCLDLCLHNVKVRLIGNGGGLVYAPLGPTHLATDDIALLRAMPRMTILAPADATEMRRMMPLTVDHPGPVYIRLGKGGDPVVTDPAQSFGIGKVFVMRTGSDAAIVSTGVMLKRALEAAEILHLRGIGTTVLHCPTIKPLDAAALGHYCGKVRSIVSVEEHSIIGGLGSAVAEILAESECTGIRRFRRLGIPDVFPDQYGSQDSLLARYDITAERIAAVISGGSWAS